MSKLEWYVAYEIVSNPGDLHIAICREDRGKKEHYSLVIRRGPGEDFRTLFEEGNHKGSRPEAARVVGDLLETARAEVLEELMRPQSQLARQWGVAKRGFLLSAFLTESKIRHIVNQLHNQDATGTYSFNYH